MGSNNVVMLAGQECVQNGLLSLFNMPCASDASVTILQEIFGDQIATLVHGTTTNVTPLIPHFLGNFNSVLITGAMLVYAVIIIVGTVNTGHHGKFLGQQWDSIWTILRVIGGTVCMVPLKYGLCAAQILVLMLVLFGVHAASTVWSASLNNVEYGTPPSVPASGIDMVRSTIANEIIMETYNQVMALNGQNTHPAIPLGTIPKANFYSGEAAGLRGNVKTLFPDFCKAALHLGSPSSTYVINFFPDSQITGADLAKLNACEQLGNDFLQSGATPHFSSAQYASIFDSGSTEPAHIWIGQNSDDPTDCAQSPMSINATCYSKFPGEHPDGSNHVYSATTTNPSTREPIKFYLQTTGGKFYDDGSWPNLTGGAIVNTTAEYIQAASAPNATQKDLSNDISTFVQDNIVTPKCATEHPDASCSNDISSIISAFNKDLASQDSSSTHTIDPTTTTPTTSSQNIPGTNTPLNSSWWNAGEIYLIIDKQMAANLSSLYKQLAQLGGTDPLGHYTAKTTAAVRLSMSLYDSGSKSRDTSSAIFTSETESDTTPTLWKNFLNDTPAIKNNPAIYNKLIQVPAADTLGFLLIGQTPQFKGHASQGVYFMVRLYDVMAANGMLDSGDSSSSLTPITSAMNKIFTGLMGSSGNGAAANVTNLMNEVYQLGLDKPSNDMISNNLSVIQRAQRTGMDMIVTTINSIESVYDHFASEYKTLRTDVEITAGVTGYTSAALAAGAVAAGFGGPFTAGTAAALGASAEVAAQTGQTAIQIMTLLKMSSLAQSLMWMPIVIVVLTSLFTAGVSFALMLPLIPFILFWAGQIAWILGTLEAIIAAPFLMLALVLPGGHHFAGHTVPGLRMLLGVIFRPVLMVLGLLIGMVLTYIVIAFSADAFHVVALTLIGGTVNGVEQSGIIPNTAYYQNANGVIACLLLFLYCSFLMLAFQKCFSPIYLLPEKVVQMMGGQADKAGEQDLQGLQQGVSQQSQSLAQSGGQAANKGIEAQQQKTQAVKGSAESGIGAVSKAGGAGKQFTYDRSAWKNHHASLQQEKDQNNGPAGLNSAGGGGGNGGGAGSGSGGGHDARSPQNNPNLQK